MLVASPISFHGTGLGDFKADAISILGPLLGKDRVRSFIRDGERKIKAVEAKIRKEAEAGARKAIPDIRAEVEDAAKKAVKPIVTVAIAVSAVGIILGGVALWRTRKR